MRRDENGDPCPSTLGEYLRLCSSIGGDKCKAVEFLNSKIANSKGGEDTEVIIDDLQMRNVLFPMLFQ